MALALGVALAGCDSTSEPTSPIGRYNLLSVDGDNMPVSIFEVEGYQLELKSGSLEMDADYSYVAVVTWEETVDINVSEYVDSLRGTWTQDAMGALEFTLQQDGSLFGGLWQGRQVTLYLADEFLVTSLVFRRSG